MAEPRVSPTLRKRRLSHLLRNLRRTARMNASDVDKHFGWADGKTARMERNVWKRPDPRDIQDLCGLYQASASDTEYLMDLARQSRVAGWWRSYADALPGPLSEFIGLEAEATTVETYELAVLPGLVQTAAYANRIIRASPYEIPSERIGRQIEARIARQEALTRSEDPLRLWAIMDEDAVTRPVCGADLMRKQMRHLLELAALPNVTLQVIPRNVGAHPGTLGAFTLLTFPDDEDDPCAYVEILGGERFAEGDEVPLYRRVFQLLTSCAMDPERTVRFIEQAH